MEMLTLAEMGEIKDMKKIDDKSYEVEFTKQESVKKTLEEESLKM